MKINLKSDKTINIITIVFVVIMFIFSVYKCQKQTNESDYITIKKSDLYLIIDNNVERAFAIGEIRATCGDIRLKNIGNNTYVWVKSPWEYKKSINDTIHVKIKLKFK